MSFKSHVTKIEFVVHFFLLHMQFRMSIIPKIMVYYLICIAIDFDFDHFMIMITHKSVECMESPT